jgi:hypothetical protein
MRARRLAQRLALAALSALLAALLAAALFAVLVPPPPPGAGRRAVIIDSLYEWVPNDELLAFLRGALEKAGYEVSVIKGDGATVDAFRNLTAYELVIIRCHGGYLRPGESLGGRVLSDYAPVVFTGERYSECLPFSCKYYLERLSEEVVRGEFPAGGANVSVFALTPLFFERMRGEFRRGSVVVVASCFGLSGRALADALLGKGAAYFISWDWKVSTQVMDEGLRMLVEEAVVKGRGWSEAVKAVAERLGPDPAGGGILKIVGSGG